MELFALDSFQNRVNKLRFWDSHHAEIIDFIGNYRHRVEPGSAVGGGHA